MGGPGSGCWYRWDKRSTAEGYRRIDIRYLKARGVLCAGSAGLLSWSCGGEPIGSVSFCVDHDHLRLRYRIRDYPEADWQDTREIVAFTSTPCHFGGERIWFRCPTCSRRVAVLYGIGSRFVCRHCAGVSYASQHECAYDRAARRADKLRGRLGWEPGILNGIGRKPKGMHWRTYRRLSAVHDAFVSRSLAGFEAVMDSRWDRILSTRRASAISG